MLCFCYFLVLITYFSSFMFVPSLGSVILFIWWVLSCCTPMLLLVLFILCDGYSQIHFLVAMFVLPCCLVSVCCPLPFPSCWWFTSLKLTHPFPDAVRFPIGSSLSPSSVHLSGLISQLQSPFSIISPVFKLLIVSQSVPDSIVVYLMVSCVLLIIRNF